MRTSSCDASVLRLPLDGPINLPRRLVRRGHPEQPLPLRHRRIHKSRPDIGHHNRQPRVHCPESKSFQVIRYKCLRCTCRPGRDDCHVTPLSRRYQRGVLPAPARNAERQYLPRWRTLPRSRQWPLSPRTSSGRVEEADPALMTTSSTPPICSMSPADKSIALSWSATSIC